MRSNICGGSEICGDVMKINDGLPTLCDTLACRLQPILKRGRGNFKRAAGAAPISTLWGGPTR